MMDEAMQNVKLRKAILEVVRNQLREGDPPETRETLERLMGEGHTEEEAMKLIGFVAASEVFDLLKQDRRYDEKKYIAQLKALPELPWEKG